MTSDRTAASIRRHIDTAFRARCVRTWPTDQPGSFEARLTSASPRSATTDLSRSCATRHPSMSAWGLTVFGGRSLGIICVLLVGGRQRRSSTQACRNDARGTGVPQGLSARSLVTDDRRAESVLVGTLGAAGLCRPAPAIPRSSMLPAALRHKAGGARLWTSSYDPVDESASDKVRQRRTGPGRVRRMG